MKIAIDEQTAIKIIIIVIKNIGREFFAIQKTDFVKRKTIIFMSGLIIISLVFI